MNVCPVHNQQDLRVFILWTIHPSFPQNNLSPPKERAAEETMNFTFVGSDRRYVQVQEEMISQHLSKYRKMQYSKLDWNTTINIGTIEIN